MEADEEKTMHDAIVPQDVLAIIEGGVRRAPRFRIAVKATKPKNVYLVLSPMRLNWKTDSPMYTSSQELTP